MFYGEYKHSIDNKGRLILPSKFREISNDHGYERFFVTRGLDKCIFMFTEEEWRVQEQKFKNMPFTTKQARQFNRLFFSGAMMVKPDKQGRFVVPDYLKEYATIEKDTILIGVSNRIEIWDQKSWSQFYDNSQESFEKIAEDMIF